MDVQLIRTDCNRIERLPSSGIKQVYIDGFNIQFETDLDDGDPLSVHGQHNQTAYETINRSAYCDQGSGVDITLDVGNCTSFELEGVGYANHVVITDRLEQDDAKSSSVSVASE